MPPGTIPVKVRRKEETPRTDRLELARAYNREELAAIVDVAPLTSTREWTGIVEFRTCVFLFVTLDKTGRAIQHAYRDEFDGPIFYWDSQSSNTPNSPVIERMANGDGDVYLFARIHEKVRGKTQPFYY